MKTDFKQFAEGVVIGLIVLVIVYSNLTPFSPIVQNLDFIPWYKLGID